MRIAFTGHRDRLTTETELIAILQKYPGAVWVHGGADGLDTQVENFAKARGITTDPIRPDYKKYHWSIAPLERNKVIVDSSDIVFACWDGRKKGGTTQAVNYAKKRGKPVYILEVVL